MENETLVSFPFISTSKKQQKNLHHVVFWFICTFAYTLHVRQCDYRTLAHCDIDAKMIYCTALPQTGQSVSLEIKV